MHQRSNGWLSLLLRHGLLVPALSVLLGRKLRSETQYAVNGLSQFGATDIGQLRHVNAIMQKPRSYDAKIVQGFSRYWAYFYYARFSHYLSFSGDSAAIPRSYAMRYTFRATLSTYRFSDRSCLGVSLRRSGGGFPHTSNTSAFFAWRGII